MCKCRQQSSSNRLSNPGFDGDAMDWLLDIGAAYRASSDADSCSGSGSIAVSGTGAEVMQCLTVNIGVPTHYYFRYRYRNWDFNSNQATGGNSYCAMSYITGSGGCDRNSVETSSDWESTNSPGTWVQGGGDGMVPTGTTRIMFRCQAVLGTGFYDQIYLSPTMPPPNF